jgi:hypothetical protein
VKEKYDDDNKNQYFTWFHNFKEIDFYIYKTIATIIVSVVAFLFLVPLTVLVYVQYTNFLTDTTTFEKFSLVRGGRISSKAQ